MICPAFSFWVWLRLFCLLKNENKGVFYEMDLRKELAPYAIEQGRLYGILPSFICAVAWLETGGGKSTLCTRAHNLFSIKGKYDGQSITLPTIEYYNGKRTTVNAKFRKYPSYRES